MNDNYINSLFEDAGRRLSVTIDAIVRDTITRAESAARKRAVAKHIHSINYSILHNGCGFMADLMTLRLI